MWFSEIQTDLSVAENGGAKVETSFGRKKKLDCSFGENENNTSFERGACYIH